MARESFFNRKQLSLAVSALLWPTKIKNEEEDRTANSMSLYLKEPIIVPGERWVKLSSAGTRLLRLELEMEGWRGSFAWTVFKLLLRLLKVSNLLDTFIHDISKTGIKTRRKI